MTTTSLLFGGRLDRYVARLFVLSYLAAFFLVVGMFLIIDMAANLDDFLRPNEDGSTPASALVVRYYLLQLPFLYLQMSPFVTLIAGLFTAAKLARNNELVAALNAGVSARRVLLPVFACAGALAAGMFVLREWATDELGARRDALRDQLEERRPAPVYENFWVHDRLGRPVRIKEFRPASAANPVPEIRGLNYRDRAGDVSTVLHADRAVPEPPYEQGVWLLEDADRLDWDRSIKSSSSPERLEGVRFTPTDVELAYKGRVYPLDLSFSQLRSLLERDGTDLVYRTLLHYHLAFPLAGLVLLAVGLPFVLSTHRGKAAERIASGFLLCVAYFGLDFVCRTLGMQGQLPPIYSGWLPILAFGSLGTVLFASMSS